MAERHRSKVVIIGSGAAGLTAAIYTARANLEPLLVAGLQPGGQMTITTDVENYPGFADVIQGPWLMEQMQLQAEHVGTKIFADVITDIDVGGPPFLLTGDSGDSYLADSVILATGARARWLGLDSEAAFNGRGVSACATCDGFFYRNQEVAVVGGGNTAVEEALYLANICSKVTLIHRRDELRAEKIGQERLFKHPKIEVIWDSVVEEVTGGDGPMAGVEGVILRNVKSGETGKLAVTGLFIAIGHDPATSIFKGKLDLDADGYITVAPGTTKTSTPGIFAAGDCVDKVFRQAITAAGMGCMAALEAEKYLAALETAQEQAAE
jgi:thioredoxin reductase (NADPH)